MISLSAFLVIKWAGSKKRHNTQTGGLFSTVAKVVRTLTQLMPLTGTLSRLLVIADSFNEVALNADALVFSCDTVALGVEPGR